MGSTFLRKLCKATYQRLSAPITSLFLAFALQGCAFRAARDPFAYAPASPYSVWTPQEKAQKRLRPCHKLPAISSDLLEQKEPLSLAETITVALHYNPNTHKSWASARQAAALYGQSLQNDFPLADFSGDYTRSRSAEFLSRQREILYETQYGGEIELRYLLLDFGQTRMTSEAALQMLYQADWLHNSQIQQTIQSLLLVYYDYLYQKKLLQAARQDVLNAQAIMHVTQEKFAMGTTDVGAIVQAQSSYLEQKLKAVHQEQAVEGAYARLVGEMGLPATDKITFQKYPGEIPKMSLEAIDALIVQAQDNRPDLLAAESAVKAELASLRAAKQMHYPKVTGNFDIGRRYYQAGLSDTYDFTATIGLTFPLFQGFFLANEVKKAQAELKKAQAHLQKVKLSMIREVATQRSGAEHAQSAVHYAKAYLEAAEKDQKIQFERYRVGTGTIVDVLNALSNVSNARARQAHAHNQWYTAIAKLAYAIGVLFPPNYPKQSPNWDFFYDPVTHKSL